VRPRSAQYALVPPAGAILIFLRAPLPRASHPRLVVNRSRSPRMPAGRPARARPRRPRAPTRSSLAEGHRRPAGGQAGPGIPGGRRAACSVRGASVVWTPALPPSMPRGSTGPPASRGAGVGSFPTWPSNGLNRRPGSPDRPRATQPGLAAQSSATTRSRPRQPNSVPLQSRGRQGWPIARQCLTILGWGWTSTPPNQAPARQELELPFDRPLRVFRGNGTSRCAGGRTPQDPFLRGAGYVALPSSARCTWESVRASSSSAK